MTILTERRIETSVEGGQTSVVPAHARKYIAVLGWRGLRAWRQLALGIAAIAPVQAHASLLHGEALDTMADVMSWVVLIVVPAVLIVVFWLVHILPEKIAEKRGHPQAKAIQCLCLLSLFFGGLFWPVAWLWAYSKPVLHQIAYGTDVDHSHGQEALPEETDTLRHRVVELEAALRAKEGQA